MSQCPGSSRSATRTSRPRPGVPFPAFLRRVGAFALAVALCGAARASWYWPIGNDAVDEKPKRVSELVEPASALIEEAADLAAEGKTDKAIEKYREALAELNMIVAQNPKRAESTEFATVRNKRAYVNAAIDSLLLEQIQENAKVVAVSDTTALERRLDRERWGRRVDRAHALIVTNRLADALVELERAKAGTTNAVQIAVVHAIAAGTLRLKGECRESCRELMRCRQSWMRAGAASAEETNLVAEVLHSVRSRVAGAGAKAGSAEARKFDVCLAAVLKRVEGEKKEEPEEEGEGEKKEEKRNEEEKDASDKGGERSSVAQVPRVSPGRETPKHEAGNPQPEVRKPKPPSLRDRVVAAISRGDWTTAERLIGEMLVAKPNGAVALNLKAAMEMRQGKFKEAEATLDQAIMSNPRSHHAYYNMANLMLQVRKDDVSVAKRYYETGRDFGGPVDAHLEEVFK